MSVCKKCKELNISYAIEEIFDYDSGVMWGSGSQIPRERFWKCSNGHSWSTKPPNPTSEEK
jgi:hypothetical protein